MGRYFALSVLYYRIQPSEFMQKNLHFGFPLNIEPREKNMQKELGLAWYFV